ncbi:MAG: hypothetical protein WD470_06570 [Rhodospirillaceae bacterium]
MQESTEMMMPLTDIRRRRDGSIDTGFYTAIGNRERGRVIGAMLAAIAAVIWGRRRTEATSQTCRVFGMGERTKET